MPLVCEECSGGGNGPFSTFYERDIIIHKAECPSRVYARALQEVQPTVEEGTKAAMEILRGSRRTRLCPNCNLYRCKLETDMKAHAERCKGRRGEKRTSTGERYRGGNALHQRKINGHATTMSILCRVLVELGCTEVGNSFRIRDVLGYDSLMDRRMGSDSSRTTRRQEALTTVNALMAGDKRASGKKRK
jgi:hypothetical protein